MAIDSLRRRAILRALAEMEYPTVTGTLYEPDGKGAMRRTEVTDTREVSRLLDSADFKRGWANARDRAREIIKFLIDPKTDAQDVRRYVGTWQPPEAVDDPPEAGTNPPAPCVPDDADDRATPDAKSPFTLGVRLAAENIAKAAAKGNARDPQRLAAYIDKETGNGYLYSACMAVADNVNLPAEVRQRCQMACLFANGSADTKKNPPAPFGD